MVAIVVVLAGITAAFVFSSTEETDPQPDVVMTVVDSEDGTTVALRHESGDTIAGNKTRLVGAADEAAFHGRQLRAGQTVEVVPTEAELTLVWSGENTDYVIQEFDVDARSLPYNPDDVDRECGWVETNVGANGDLDMSGDAANCNVKDDLEASIDDVNVDLQSGALLVGDVDTDGDVDLDGSKVVGDVVSNADDITITGASSVYGTVIARSGTNIDIDGNSYVRGDVVVKGGSLSLNSVDIDGHVYASDDDFPSSCTDTTIGPDEESCSEYDPRDPSDA
jgi:FlaG/FlaF family flagellin (archaellin)